MFCCRPASLYYQSHSRHTQLSHKYWINRKKYISVTQECEARQVERKYKTDEKTLALKCQNIYTTEKQISQKWELLHHFERRFYKKRQSALSVFNLAICALWESNLWPWCFDKTSLPIDIKVFSTRIRQKQAPWQWNTNKLHNSHCLNYLKQNKIIWFTNTMCVNWLVRLLLF